MPLSARECELRLVRRPWTKSERKLVLRSFFQRSFPAVEPAVCFVVFAALTAGLVFFPLSPDARLTRWESATVIAPIFAFAAVCFFGYTIGVMLAPVRALSRILGLRTCTKRIAPAPDFSPCIYGQMGHCASPCSQRIDADSYAANVRRAIDFVRGRSTLLLSAIAVARDQAARAMRFEEAGHHQRDLDALRLLAIRGERFSQIVVENNLVIITRAAAEVPGFVTVRVILSGRLASEQTLESRAVIEDSTYETARFVRENFERYRAASIERGDLDAMMIVARWLREREPSEGRLIYLYSKEVPVVALRAALVSETEACAEMKTPKDRSPRTLSPPAD